MANVLEELLLDEDLLLVLSMYWLNSIVAASVAGVFREQILIGSSKSAAISFKSDMQLLWAGGRQRATGEKQVS